MAGMERIDDREDAIGHGQRDQHGICYGNDVVFDDVFQQKLQCQRRQLRLHILLGDVLFETNAVAQSDPVQEKIGPGEMQLVGKRHQPLVLTLQHVPIDIGEVAGKGYGPHGIIFDFGDQRIEAVEEKMRVQLLLQRRVTGPSVSSCKAAERRCNRSVSRIE